MFSLLALLLHLSSFHSLSLAYELPDKNFINCGSDAAINLTGRTFIADDSFYSQKSKAVKASNQLPDNISTLYQTARIFSQQSYYKFEISENGTYLVRLHFLAFSSSVNLSTALFDVLAFPNVSNSGFKLLSNFTAKNSSNSPLIKEFFLGIDPGTFKIYFVPQASSFAFVNAIEVFLAPASFSPENYNSSLPLVLHTIYRVNVGGEEVAPDTDRIWRNWEQDDRYLSDPNSAEEISYPNKPSYYNGELNDPATHFIAANDFIAPDSVYRTAKEMNITPSRPFDSFNITWSFNAARRNARHLVRVHFCDIIGQPGNIVFNLYSNGNFSKKVGGYQSLFDTQSATPFYYDFVVSSNESQLISISVGARNKSTNNTAFLNGLEMLEIMEGSVSVSDVKESVKKMLTAIRGVKISFAEVQRATNNFDDEKLLGEGGFGNVYRGTLLDGRKVAVKRAKKGSRQGLGEFHTEIKILSKILHRHLVSLIGYCDEKSEMIIVYEFMENGTLSDHLYASDVPRMPWKQRLEICIGAARGLDYLHTVAAGGIIHRDVKSNNILLDENNVAKVADFGLSKHGSVDETHVVTKVKGTIGYLDPDYMMSEQLSEKSDVYSFGVVLLEVLCGRPPIDGNLPRDEMNLAEWVLHCKTKGLLEQVVDSSLEGQIDAHSLRVFSDTAEKCLRKEANDRPTMGNVLSDLEYALRLHLALNLRELSFEDSTANASSAFIHVGRLPSLSSTVNADDTAVSADGSVDTTPSQIFSQLKFGDAR
ncbi:hypothetical protein Pyn_34771 [Prunus yedoensis var. nudiflora]|uniref:Protein kinase domain-containing protein n=1 Tax=Prunus yedoensis var. nudiflora TaxID=2094558 RepID=A0A314ZF02_PRUYE|nr:hypothetical protein Pyn_34771 [Prunus yedoensis var. nudiflora]